MAGFLLGDPSKRMESESGLRASEGEWGSLTKWREQVGIQVGGLPGHRSACEGESHAKSSEGRFQRGLGDRQPLRDPSLQLINKRHPRQATVSRK